MTCPAVAGHRGSNSTEPELTFPALVSAANSGADYLEMDIRFTKAGGPVLMHDATVDRTTDGTGAVADLYWSDLKQLDAGSWFSPAFAGVRVADWQSVLNLFQAGAVGLMAELKGVPTDAQVDTFLGYVTARGMGPRVVVASFESATLAKVHARAPAIRLALLVTQPSADPVADARAAGATYYQPQHQYVTAELVATLHTAGVLVWPWTADEPGDWQRLAVAGVDGVITNRPAVYEGWALARCG